MSTTTTDPAANLRAVRTRLGLSYRKLSVLLAVQYETLYRWEHGKRTIQHPELLRRALRDLEQELAGACENAGEPGESA